MNLLPACINVHRCMPGAHKGQKKEVDPLGLEL